jgi:hypothetical protein
VITLQTNKADILKIESELNLKVGGAKELSSPVVLEELGNAIFTMSAKSFVKAMNMEAKANPKAFHHIYEWNKVGLNPSRLFFLYKEVNMGGKLIIKPAFRKSRTPVPIAKELLQPGKTGKMVSSRYVFKDKASVMESGKPIVYRASKNIPMVENGQVRFVAAGTVIKNLNPGGREVKGSFEKFYEMWFATKVNDVIRRSGITKAIDSELAKILNKRGAGPAQVRTAIISLLKQYSMGIDVV